MWPLKIILELAQEECPKKLLRKSSRAKGSQAGRVAFILLARKCGLPLSLFDVLVTFCGKFLAINATKLSHLSPKSNYCQRSTLSITLFDGCGYVVGFVFLTSGNDIIV